MSAETGAIDADKALDDKRRWMFDHFRQYVQDGCINVTKLEIALAAHFGEMPNPKLNKIVVDFFIDLQEMSQQCAFSGNLLRNDCDDVSQSSQPVETK